MHSPPALVVLGGCVSYSILSEWCSKAVVFIAPIVVSRRKNLLRHRLQIPRLPHQNKGHRQKNPQVLLIPPRAHLDRQRPDHQLLDLRHPPALRLPLLRLQPNRLLGMGLALRC